MTVLVKGNESGKIFPIFQRSSLITQSILFFPHFLLLFSSSGKKRFQ